MLISPELSSTSSLHDQAGAAAVQNAALQSKIARLRHQNDNLPALTASLRDSLAALPLDSGLPDFTRQVSAQAAAAHVSLSAISVGTIGPASIGATDPAAPVAPGSSAGKLYAVPVTLIATGSAKNDLAFLTDIQTAGPRRALVTRAQLAPGPGSQVASIDTSATMTVQLTIFAAPRSPEATAQLLKQLNGHPAG